MAEAACGTPSTTAREKALIQLTAVKTATSSLPPAPISRAFTVSMRRVWSRLFNADGLPVAAISRQSSRAVSPDHPRWKLLSRPHSQQKPMAQAAAVAMTLAQAAPPIPMSRG